MLHIETIRYDLVCLLPNIVPGRRIGNLCTDDTTAATLSDHLLRSVLIAQECAASVDALTHQAASSGVKSPPRLLCTYRLEDRSCARLP